MKVQPSHLWRAQQGLRASQLLRAVELTVEPASRHRPNLSAEAPTSLMAWAEASSAADEMVLLKECLLIPHSGLEFQIFFQALIV